MRAWQVVDNFGLENLRLVTLADEEPGPGEVLLELRACSLNYRDLLVVRGHYNAKIPLPFTPLSDGVGAVLRCGSDVNTFSNGDRVMGAFAPTWIEGSPSRDQLRKTLGSPLCGMLRQRLVVPESWLVRVPTYLSDTEAATLPCAAVTAWSALKQLSEVGPGSKVLTLGTGGVSLFVLQLAQRLGAQVAITSSSDKKLAKARELGAAFTVNYKNELQWGKIVRDWAKGGVDHVVELGGAGTLTQSLSAIRPGGHISLIGVLSGTSADLDLLPIVMNQVRVQGVMVGSKTGLEDLAKELTQHKIKPVIDRVFGFEEAREALSYLESGAHFGKVCIQIAN